MRTLLLVSCLLLACSIVAIAQDQAAEWSFGATAFGYFVPDDQDYGAATFTADRQKLHLEARYNYEDLDTGSVWVGYNFSVGETWVFDAVPMLGGVFGQTTGIAPGWELTLSHGRFEVYSESEVVFDLEDVSDNFYYNWSELTFSPVESIRFGLVVQRTKAYQTDLDVQRGILLGATAGRFDVCGYIFNLGWEDPTVVISAGVSF